MADFTLSRRARALWAKTGCGEQSNLWEPLYVHMLDSAGIGRILWSDWIADSTRRYIADTIGVPLDSVRTLVSFTVGVHDIGKATPNFQRKVSDRSEWVQHHGLAIPSEVPRSYQHSFMGQLILVRWLKDRGWDENVASQYACIVGGHHGMNPSSATLGSASGLGGVGIADEQELRPKCVLGDSPWFSVQNELLTFMAETTGFTALETQLRTHLVPPSAQVLLTGLTIMADWIASNTQCFPLVDLVVNKQLESIRVKQAWRYLALPNAEHFVEPEQSNSQLFRHRFPELPRGAQLRPIQDAAIKAAEEMDSPGLLIIEADTGGGKTEASLLAAEILASKFGEGGLAYLLPTQATSNAMYTRVESWLESVHSDFGDGEVQDIHLLHGKAALNEDWQQLPHWGESWMGDPAGNGKSAPRIFEDAVIAHQWFSGRKRGLLAPFVVGTVDQLLFMALKAKHVHLRHLGIAGKVVVIDEVHAYDAYMNVYLDRALDFLGKYHVPVILLSATLPPERRIQLIRAYRGQDSYRTNSGRRSRRRKAGLTLDKPLRTVLGAPCYPLITSSGSNQESQPVYRTCDQDDGRNMTFEVEFMPDDDGSLVGMLHRSLKDGGCICVLRDTVRRAQETYALLAEKLSDVPDIRLELVHSRFIAQDRADNDARLLKELGANSHCRPRTLVVVGTQVIEQSLDIDFDMLITDIAPVDLLLQRMGRVHRHTRGEDECNRPEVLRKARCMITGIESWENSIPHFAKGLTSVYEEQLLLRTVLALADNGIGQRCCVTTPADTASLVERVYSSGESVLAIPESWRPEYEKAKGAAEKRLACKRRAANTYLLGKFPPKPRRTLQDWMNESTRVDDEITGSAKVRDGQESVEVVLVQKHGGQYCVLPWVADKLDVNASLGDGQTPAPDDAAHAAALCCINLPPVLCNPSIIDKVVTELDKPELYSGWQESRWLKAALILPLDDSYQTTIELENSQGGETIFTLIYSREEGLSSELKSERR